MFKKIVINTISVLLICFGVLYIGLAIRASYHRSIGHNMILFVSSDGSKKTIVKDPPKEYSTCDVWERWNLQCQELENGIKVIIPSPNDYNPEDWTNLDLQLEYR